MMSQFKLFASGLSQDVDEDTLMKHIERVDKSIRVKGIIIMRDYQTFRSKGLAIIEFPTQEECDKALKALNFTEILGNELNLCPYRPGGMRDKVSSNLFVKNLSGETKSVDLYQLFTSHGKIFSCRVKYNPNGTCKGYGYVQFESKDDADKALKALDNTTFKGTKIAVAPFLASGSRSASFMKYNNLFVKNLPKRFTDKDLIGLFESNGEIVSAVVIKESPDAAENKGFGFVCFKKAEDAKNAEEKLKDLSYEGQTLYVCRALPKEERRRQLREERLKAFKDCNLYVKELPEDITDEKLKAAFDEFGKVVSARVMLERRQNLETGETEMKSRGFGFVCFSEKQEASNTLMAASSRPILGRMLYVAIAEKKEDRQARMTGPFPIPFPGPRPAGVYSVYGMPPYGYPGPYPQMRPRRPRNDGRGRRRYPDHPQHMMPIHGMPPMAPMPPYGMPPPMQTPMPAEAPMRELPSDKEQLGEYLYPLVELKSPEYAAKITGMLLEMEIKQIHNIIVDPNQLDKWIAEAMRILSKS